VARVGHGRRSVHTGINYHPWNEEQGQSPFVWSIIGALSEAVSLPVTTAVTCPTMRLHPAVIAQATATSAVQLDGRFVLGVGTGEAPNEHILGDAWPSAGKRMAMLEEAVEVIRLLHRGELVSHRGTSYEVQEAKIYTRTEAPVPIYVSGFGPQAAALAGRIGDGRPPAVGQRRPARSAGADSSGHGRSRSCLSCAEPVSS
jgi:G6PDH family F420-dependent oxidoreductase